jgi:hypothetical protein
MTVYGAEVSGGGVGTGSLTVGIKAGIYPIKLISILLTVGTTASDYAVTMYSGATLSAGSVITPFPLRGGAPAASATARSGAPTGTSTPLKVTGANNAANTVLTYTTPANLIIPSGSALGVVLNPSWLIIVYFDELEIQPGY